MVERRTGTPVDQAASDRSSPAASWPERREIVTSQGLRIVADRRGRPDRPPVVFLHGAGQTRHAWAGAAERVAARGWQTWCVDLRGHGESDWAPDADYGTEAFVDDLQAVIRYVGRAPVLVGASWGGIVGLFCEGELAPGLLRALVLVDIATRLQADGIERIVAFMRSAPDGFASLEEAADAVAAYRPGRPRPRDLDGLRKNLRRGEDGRWHWHWDPAFLQTRQRMRARTPDRLETAARRLESPTLLVRGQLSDMVSPEAAQRFLLLCPHAEYQDVAAAGHMVVGDRNDAFTDALLEFLDTHVGQAD